MVILKPDVMFTGSVDQTAKMWEIPADSTVEISSVVVGIAAVDGSDASEKENDTQEKDSTAIMEETKKALEVVSGNVDSKEYDDEKADGEEDKATRTGAKDQPGPVRKRGARGGARGSKSKKSAARGLSAYEVDTVAQGELARVLYARMAAGKMTPQLVAMAPSCGLWYEAMASWARQLENAGQIRDAALAWASMGKVERAVNLLAEHGLRDSLFCREKARRTLLTKMLRAQAR